MARILILEDDPTLQRVLRDNFVAAGHSVTCVGEGERGLEAALSGCPDLLILDIMLPGINGFEICRQLRQEQFAGAILMLTARVEDTDAVLGLGLGADDYVRKPFNMRELLARADAVIRRSATEKAESVRFGLCELDLQGHRLMREGKAVDLSPKEYELLVYLVEHHNRAMSREQIMTAVWGYDARVSERSIDRFITTLRKKIEPNPRHPVHLITVRQYGYKFMG